jgi:hypothetical protein
MATSTSKIQLLDNHWAHLAQNGPAENRETALRNGGNAHDNITY